MNREYDDEEEDDSVAAEPHCVPTGRLQLAKL
jgi:hypothetical protein